MPVKLKPQIVPAAVAALLVVALASGSAAAYQRPGRSVRISQHPDGSSLNGYSWLPEITPDGRFVVMANVSSDLVPGDDNAHEDVFVYSRLTGVIERVSVASDGTQGNDESSEPAISDDGRLVAFQSDAFTLVAGDANFARDVFVHDRISGVTELVSVATGGGQGNDDAYYPDISADGRYVAFVGEATNLVPGDTNDRPDAFVHDRETGVTERVSVASDGTPGNNTSWLPVLSDDGRFVAFQSNASNLDPRDTNAGVRDIFLHDRRDGTTIMLSRAVNGGGSNSQSSYPSISADGRFVAFDSYSSDLVPGDTNGFQDAFVYDVTTGVTERVSVDSAGRQATPGSERPVLSPDGRFVAFNSTATSLVPGDANASRDTFLRDRLLGITERVSVRSDGTEVSGNSSWASVSAGGRYVALMGYANLGDGESGLMLDVHVRDRGPITGVGGLQTTSGGGTASVSGWATFSGRVLVSATDNAGDGGNGARDLGGELVGASVTHRVEQEDLLVRIRPASFPTPSGAGAPGVVYGLELTVGTSIFQVRAARVNPSAGNAVPSFGLYRCETTCTLVSALTGGLGQAGPDVTVALPLAALGSPEPALGGLRAFTAIGDINLPALQGLDDLSLGSTQVVSPAVELGVSSGGAAEGEVAFTVPATLSGGSFSGTMTAASGERLWARACLGSTCGSASSVVG